MPAKDASRATDAAPSKFSLYSRKLLFGFSPWLIAGLSAVFALAIVLLALRNSEREREYVTRNFLDRADALIWALEAATKTGIALGGEANILQPFVMAAARRQGLLYIAVVDAEGQVLAHSNPREVGKLLPEKALPSVKALKEVAWRIIRGTDGAVFEAYRSFSPAPGYRHCVSCSREKGHREDRRASGPAERFFPRSIALIGFDSEPYEAILARERFSNLATAFVAAALAIGSSFSLFWADGWHRSRRLLKDTRALASEVVSSLPVGFITCEPGGAIGMVNDAALAMLRMDRVKVAGASIHAVPGLDWEGLIADLARNEKMIEREMAFKAHDAVTPVSVSASRIRNEDGLFLGHLFILRDVSEMKRLQAESRRNDKLAALGSLAAGVAHEIRNPLSSIKGLATFLLAKTRASEAEAEAAKSMIAEVDRLNRVVSQLLEFAKPRAVKLADTDVNAVVRRALRLADADIRSKRIRVSFAESERPLPVPMHAERFTQALLNIFLNAVQSMEAGGNLDISVGLRDGGSMCGVRVTDDGAGMPEEVLASIFTPYFTTKVSGAGLGLAIVHQIVEEHGGEISVESAPGSGSSFTLLLPLQRKNS
ncbi:MAG: PAS domain S-box protein [Desulfovibrio sp.]|jgi:two-component system sensor histidine kinase HydH|nr:PAS domain S-box protein [Desulfovibrio sp.]